MRRVFRHYHCSVSQQPTHVSFSLKWLQNLTGVQIPVQWDGSWQIGPQRRGVISIPGTHQPFPWMLLLIPCRTVLGWTFCLDQVSVRRATSETDLRCLLFWLHSFFSQRCFQTEGQPERGEGPTLSGGPVLSHVGCLLDPQPGQQPALSSPATSSSNSAAPWATAQPKVQLRSL